MSRTENEAGEKAFCMKFILSVPTEVDAEESVGVLEWNILYVKVIIAL